MKSLRLILVALVVSVGLAGCASERYQAEARKMKAQKDQYVDYTPVGSNIPVKIPKDEAKTSEKETEEAQRVFREAQRSGVRTPGDPAVQAANATNPATR